jgi:hypothetical protein
MRALWKNTEENWFSLDVADIHMRLRGLNFLQIQIDGFS